jgi:hypothetical protein
MCAIRRNLKSDLTLSASNWFGSALAVLGVVLYGGLLTPTHGDPLTLNFATVNQSLWGPGNATVMDGFYAIPDPAINQPFNLSDFDVSPTGALLSFLGLSDIGPSLTVHPSADVTAGITASYHVNSGSIDLNYPQQAVLSLPDTLVNGETFNVGLNYPGTSLAIKFQASNFQSALQAAGAGAGYTTARISALLPSFINSLESPQPGFTTVSPFAEATIHADFSVAANLHGEACIGLAVTEWCPFDGDISLGSTALDQDILKLSTLTGLQVLGQSVIDLSNTRFDLPLGLGSGDFSSPSLNLSTDTVNGDGTLSAGGSNLFLNMGLDVDQLVPLVGQILHNSLGPFSYDLLSIQPTIGLTLHQELIFDPTLMVNLHFSDPVTCLDCSDTDATWDVSFAAGETRTLMPATVGSILHPTTVTPTFSLDNTFHNITYVTLDGSVDIDALGLTAPVTTGFALQDSFPLFSVPLPGIDIDTSFILGIPSITTASKTLARGGNLAQLMNAHVTDVINDATGNHQYDLELDVNGQPINASAFGRLVQIPLEVPGDCGPECNPCNYPGIQCETYFQADQDVVVGNANLGRLLCITCISLPGGLSSPFLVDENGAFVFFSDLNDVPVIPTADDIVDPTSPFYDAVLASNELVGEVFTTPGGEITNNPRGTPPVPEPGSLYLLWAGLAALFLSRYKPKLRPDELTAWPKTVAHIPTLA